MGFDYESLLDSAESSSGITAISLLRNVQNEDCISTGSLTYDLISGGGWPPGRWVTLVGPEAGGKSTFMFFSMKEAIKQGVPIVSFLDYENALEANYVARILRVSSIDNIFGEKDSQGKWVIKPKARYYPDLPDGESGFELMHSILMALPIKEQLGTEWFYVYPNTKDNMAKYKGKYSTKLKSKTGKLYVPCPDGGRVQAIFFIDSYANMVPRFEEENPDSGQRGTKAAMFSKHIPRIKNKLLSRRAILVGVNQLRLNPGAGVYANPEYEVGGEALKYAADARTAIRPRSVPHGKGPIEEERTWDDTSIDKYKYTFIRTIKNKMTSPFREAWLRIWFENAGRPGYGIDPVWDCHQFLQETGQLSGRTKFTLTLPGPWYNYEFSWADFKYMVLNPNRLQVYKEYGFKDPSIEKILDSYKQKGEEKLRKEHIATIKKIMDIIGVCRQQLETNKAFELYFNYKGGLVQQEEE